MINIVYRLKSPKFFEESIDEIELDGVVVKPTHLSICQADQRYFCEINFLDDLKEAFDREISLNLEKPF